MGSAIGEVQRLREPGQADARDEDGRDGNERQVAAVACKGEIDDGALVFQAGLRNGRPEALRGVRRSVFPSGYTLNRNPDLDSISRAFPAAHASIINDDLAYPAMLTFLPSGLLGLVQPLLGRAFDGIAKGAVSGMKRELDARA